MLSLCMIVKDEGPYIAACLESVRSLVQEMIIVDTGSTDDTVKIAHAYGAKVFTYQWNNDFSAARNFSLSKATGDWVLVLDADEVLDEQALTEIPLLMKTSLPKGFQLLQRSYTDDTSIGDWKPLEKPVKGKTGYFDAPLTRLFPKNPLFTFRYALHEDISLSIIDAGGTIEKTTLLLHHFGHCKQSDTLAKKREKYLSILLESVRYAPNDHKAHFELGRMYREQKDLEKAARCFETAVILDPDFARAHAALGEVLQSLMRYEDAKEHLLLSLAEGFDDEQVYSNLGIVQSKLGHFKEAYEAFEKALAKNPKSARVMHNLGALLVMRKRYQEALDLFTYAHDITHLERFLHQKKYLEQKLQAHAQQLQKEFQKTHSLEVAYALAEVYAQWGKEEDRLLILEEAIVHTPRKDVLMVRVYTLLIQAYKKSKPLRAMQLLEKVLSWNPPNADTLRKLHTTLAR